MSLIHATKENFEQNVLKNSGTVLVDFWATWCGPCRMIAPILEEISQENNELTICKVDVDQEMELAMTYKISSIPTLLVFRNGELVNKAIGAMPKEEILALL